MTTQKVFDFRDVEDRIYFTKMLKEGDFFELSHVLIQKFKDTINIDKHTEII